MNMKKRMLKNSFLTIALIASDGIAVLVSFVLAYYLRAWLLADLIPLFPRIEHGIDVYLKAWGLLSLWLIIFTYENLYPSVGMGFWEETKYLLSGSGLSFIILIFLTFITKTSIQYSRPVIFLAFMASIVLLPLMRGTVRSILRRIGLWQKEVLIVGFPNTTRQVLCNLKKHPDWGLKPVGLVFPQGHPGPDPVPLPVYQDIERAGRAAHSIEEVIVAMPSLPPTELAEIVERSMKISPVVKVVPDLYGIASSGVRTHDLDGMLLLEMVDRLARKRNRAVKRAFDVVLSFLGLIALAPVFLAITIAIKLDSRGPAFYGHMRLGKDGRYFSCYKFRSMRSDAQAVLEDLLGNDPEARAEWERDFKLKNDPRITRVGSFLRKTSLDELPQLWNVLKGDMSLVGPRPIVAEEAGRYGDKLRYLFKVPPGITGLWQVSGRNDIPYGERILLDEYYAKNWSLWLDVEIIMRTFSAVLKKDGAY